jgi:hypothetical protein
LGPLGFIFKNKILSLNGVVSMKKSDYLTNIVEEKDFFVTE